MLSLPLSSVSVVAHIPHSTMIKITGRQERTEQEKPFIGPDVAAPTEQHGTVSPTTRYLKKGVEQHGYITRKGAGNGMLIQHCSVHQSQHRFLFHQSQGSHCTNHKLPGVGRAASTLGIVVG